MFSKITLETQLIKLVPMTMDHLDAYCLAGNHPEVWRWMPINRCADKTVAQAWLNEAITEMQAGRQLALMIIDKQTNELIGSTRLFRLNEKDKCLELGYTFITPKFQRKYVNSHAKFLLLQYVFEVMKLTRVEICTNEFNQKSRTAITRIGGHFEGILRKHRKSPNGEYRNTAMFSIIDDEWSAVKGKLLATGIDQSEFYHVSC
jgi:RimJ/RimL family protein N-acetyltransferase